MKTAIILSGNLRTFMTPLHYGTTHPRGELHGAWLCDLFARYIVATNNADVFAYTDTNDFYYNGSVYYTKDVPKELCYPAVNVDNTTAKNIIYEQMKFLGTRLKFLHVEEPFDISTDPKFTLINSSKKLGGKPLQIISQFRKVKLAYNMMKKYEASNNFKYDFVIKWRFDNMLKQPLHLNNYDFTDIDAYVPGVFVPLVYDWHAFGKRRAMDACLSLYDIIGSYLHEGPVYHCKSGHCNIYGHNENCCTEHGGTSEITLSPEYHLYRAFMDRNIRIKGSGYYSSPRRYGS